MPQCPRVGWGRGFMLCLLVGSPMLNRSKGRGQTRSGPPVLQVRGLGSGLATPTGKTKLSWKQQRRILSHLSVTVFLTLSTSEAGNWMIMENAGHQVKQCFWTLIVLELPILLSVSRTLVSEGSEKCSKTTHTQNAKGAQRVRLSYLHLWRGINSQCLGQRH